MKRLRGRYAWGVAGLAVLVAMTLTAPAADAGEKGYMGVYMQELTRDIREGLSLDVKRGVLISGVENDSPAAKAGLEDGDVIVKVGGKPVDDPDQLRELVMDREPGETVSVEVIRDGENKTFDVVLGERESGFTWYRGDDSHDFGRRFHSWAGDGHSAVRAMLGGPRLGVQASELNDDLASYFDTEARSGILVLDVIDDSIAEEAGLKAGDVIQKIADEDISSIADIRDALSQFDEGDEFKVTVLRKGKATTLDATMNDQSTATFWSGEGPRVHIDRLPRIDRDDVNAALDELRQEIKELKKQLKELKDDA